MSSRPQQRRTNRSLWWGLALLVAVLATACAPAPPAAPRQLVAADLGASTVADEVDVPYGPLADHTLDVYRTRAESRRGTIVFVHGGGWTTGSKEALTDGVFGPVLAQLERGFDIVSINYRLAPEHPFPAAFDDVGLAVDWVRSQGPGRGLDVRRVALVGHSAGGSLTAMVGTQPGQRSEFGRIPRVDRWVAIAAMSTFSGEGLLADFPGDWGLDSPQARSLVSPLSTLDRNDPPGYLIHGDRDVFVADWHSVLLAGHAGKVGARVQLDHITVGSDLCRGHYSPCGADLGPLDRFLG
jgi:acetyl esterase/lipase